MISKKAKIGKNTIIYNPDLVYIEDCQVGDNCKIQPFVTIQSAVKIGNFCKIEHYVFIPSGVIIKDEVFIGQGVCFTNDKYPRSTIAGRLKRQNDYRELSTKVERGASIGSNSTILPGITIGEKALVGAGSVVTKDVPPYSVAVGNPARILRKIKY